MEPAQRYLEAKERYPVGSEYWAHAASKAFDELRHKECDEVAKPEWWNDEGLKALSVRVVRALPNGLGANDMRANVLSGCDNGAYEVGFRSAAEQKEAAAHFERAAAMHPAPLMQAELAELAEACRSKAEVLELLVEGARHASKGDLRRAAKACRDAIALRPNDPTAYYNLGGMLCGSGHYVEAAQRFLEAMERYPVDSEDWAEAIAAGFDMLRLKECGEVAKPEWWNDEGLKALSARVVKAAPNHLQPNTMRALVLSGLSGAWEVGPRSAAEQEQAAAHFERAAVMHTAPVTRAEFAKLAEVCRSQAEGM